MSNLSCDGLFLRSEYLDARGAEVHLDLDLPGNENPLQLRGEVVRIDETPLSSGMAIRFTGVEQPTRRQLANYLLLKSSRASQ